jgi:hypothetical protein
MMHETPYERRLNDDPVSVSPAQFPSRCLLTGSLVHLEPIDPDRHTTALYRAGHASEAARQSWQYLPWGPFPSEAACTRSCMTLPLDLIACSMQFAAEQVAKRSARQHIWIFNRPPG